MYKIEYASGYGKDEASSKKQAIRKIRRKFGISRCSQSDVIEGTVYVWRNKEDGMNDDGSNAIATITKI